MRIYTTIAASAAAIVIASSASALTLTGTIRDFSDTHPDMQRAIDGVQTGKVDNKLDADGKPVFIGEENKAGSSFSTPDNFAQWYRTEDGVNKEMSLNLTLSESGGIYSFSDTTFFPINDMLLGNEGRSNNYHFTYEVSGLLAYHDLSQEFTFNGDDDLWVFVGNHLALDIGGVHGATEKTFTGADLDALGLAANTNHALKIFFAERHTTQSTFEITTDFKVAPSPIPVPAALPLLLSGLGGLGFLARKRRKQA